MKDKGDAYRIWLGIPRNEQPPHHYRLLGIQLYESDPAVIEHAVTRQSLQLKSVQTGPHAKFSQQLLNEVHAARNCLQDAVKKAGYDTSLARTLGQTDQPVKPIPEDAVSLVVSPSRSRPVQSSKSKRPAARPVLEMIKIVLGAVAGLFLAVLMLSYFAGIDLLRPKNAANKSVAKPNVGKTNSVPDSSAPAESSSSKGTTEPSPGRLASQSEARLVATSPVPKPVGESTGNQQTSEGLFSGSLQGDPQANHATQTEVANAAGGSSTIHSDPKLQPAELLARMRAMPPPYVDGEWSCDGNQLIIEGTPDKSLLFIFGDPQWKDYDLRVEMMVDKPGTMHSIVFLSEDSQQWEFGFGGAEDSSKEFELVPLVEGELISSAKFFARKALSGELGRWYVIDVQVRGPKVTALIDGKLVAQSEHAKLLQGRIGAACEGPGRGHWRNFEVRTTKGELLWHGLPPLASIEGPGKVASITSPNGTASAVAEIAAASASELTPEQKKVSATLVKMNRELSAYRLELVSVRKLMFKAFDDAEAKVRGSKIIADSEKVSVLARLGEERKAFDAAGYLPFSAVMRSACPGYLSKRKRAEETLRNAFDKQIASLIKSKEADIASLLQQQRDIYLAPTVVARWGISDWTLHSDSTAHHEKWGDGRWEWRGDTYVIHWKLEASVVTCQLNGLGDRFDGQDLRGHKFTGQWLPPLGNENSVDRRTAWKNADSEFVQFRQLIEGVWAEMGNAGASPTKTWLQVGRTSDYVELEENGGNRFARLYGNRVEWAIGKTASERRWDSGSKGAWQHEGIFELAPEPVTPDPVGWRITKNGIPLIDGIWDGFEKRRILITQKGERLTLVSEFQDPREGPTRWEGEGTITKEGKMSMIVNVFRASSHVQTRTGQLSIDGKTISGSSVRGNTPSDFTWTFVGPQ